MRDKLGPFSCMLPFLGLALGFGIMMLPQFVRPWEPGWINDHRLELEFGGVFVFAGAVGIGGLLGLVGLLVSERKGWAGLGLALNLAFVAGLIWLYGAVSGGFGVTKF